MNAKGDTMNRDEHIGQAERCLREADLYAIETGAFRTRDEKALEVVRHWREMAHVHILIAQLKS